MTISIIKYATYDGSRHSLKILVERLRLELLDCDFNIYTHEFFIHSLGILYRPGDTYAYKINETFLLFKEDENEKS